MYIPFSRCAEYPGSITKQYTTLADQSRDISHSVKRGYICASKPNTKFLILVIISSSILKRLNRNFQFSNYSHNKPYSKHKLSN